MKSSAFHRKQSHFLSQFWTGLFSILLSIICGIGVSHAVQPQNSEDGNQPTLTIDLSTPPTGTITASLLGCNNPMTAMPSRAFFDPNTRLFPSAFYEKISALGLRSLRFPGGNTSGIYHWQYGIGPQENRPAGLDGTTGRMLDDYYTFGFMEFMDFLETIGASDPIICINFGTGSAEEAAAWVEFANADAGADPDQDGVDQAQIRAALGHPEPFGIRFWEIGNELGDPYIHMFSWHFGQLSDLSEDYALRCRNYLLGGDQWQYMDMDDRDFGQRLVRSDDWSSTAAESDGSPNQEFYVKYPPVMAGSCRLWVWIDDQSVEEWLIVDDLIGQPPDAKVFTLNTQNGQILFGDGQHGQIPPPGSKIRAVYQSIDQDGIIDFYQQMKQVDPDILIGAPFTDEIFFQEATAAGFDELPFDFIVDHPYQRGQPNLLEEEHWWIQWAAWDQAPRMAQHRQNLDDYFGDQKSIGIVVSEYNLVYMGYETGESTNPWYGGQQLDYFGRSLDNGLFIAGALMSYLKPAHDVHLWALHIHSLVPGREDVIDGWPLSALMGPVPFQYLNPSGHVYSCLSQCFGHHIMDVQMDHVPVYPVPITEGRDTTMCKPAHATSVDTAYVPYMEAMATRNTTGDTLCLFVLNRTSALPEASELVSDISATIGLNGSNAFNHAKIFTLHGEFPWTINSSDQPENVTLRFVGEHSFTNSFQWSFPSHSLTMICITSRETPILETKKITPNALHLCQNFPNPFNPVTTIRYDLPEPGNVTLKIFNIMGEEVKSLADREKKKAGHHSEIWDGRTQNGDRAAAGLYFIQMRVGGFTQTRKMLLVE